MYNEKITLMHDNIPVASYSIDEFSGKITSSITVLDEATLPFSVRYNQQNDYMMVSAMQEWVAARSVSASRKKINELLSRLEIGSPSSLSYKSFGLNLTDHYWFKPTDVDLKWEYINYFENSFQKQHFSSFAHIKKHFESPDLNLNGQLDKFWCIENNKRMLYKEGNSPFYFEPYNEVIASEILDLLGLDHVHYQSKVIDGKAYSVCETFSSVDEEYIPASDILEVEKKSNNENSYHHFFRCVKKLDIPISNLDIDNVLIFDYLISNSDRHYGNFGFIRDTNTLEFKRLAPIFDNGNSLWFDKDDYDISLSNRESKPFKKTHDKQIKLVKESKLNLKVISKQSIEQLFEKVFSSVSRFSDYRKTKIINCVLSNLQTLDKYFNKLNSLFL